MENTTAQVKIQSLCEALRQEALLPAQQQAAQLLDRARQEAEDLVQSARQEAERTRQISQQQMRQERALFDTSLRQAAAQSLRALRAEIEEKLFKDQLAISLQESLNDPVTVTRIIQVLVEAIARDGLGADLTVEISQQIDLAALNALLGQGILKALRGGTCLKSTLKGGARIRVHDRALTFDLSDQFVSELLQSHLRSEFAKLVFQAPEIASDTALH